MNSINHVQILGHLGSDPEVRTTNGGRKVAGFSVATSRKFKDRDAETTWHRVVAWEALADVAGNYLAKGSPVLVNGRIQIRPWTDQSGVERQSFEIVAEEIVLIGGGSDHRGSRSDDDRDGASRGPSGRPPQAQAQRGNGHAQNGHGQNGRGGSPARGHSAAARGSVVRDDLDDDIPF